MSVTFGAFKKGWLDRTSAYYSLFDHPSQVSICFLTLPKLSVDMNVKSPKEKARALILTICYLYVK